MKTFNMREKEGQGGESCGCFLLLRKPLLVSYCVLVQSSLESFVTCYLVSTAQENAKVAGLILQSSQKSFLWARKSQSQTLQIKPFGCFFFSIYFVRYLQVFFNPWTEQSS